MRAALTGVFLSLLVGCGGGRAAVSTSDAPRGIVLVKSQPQASVWIDGRHLGEVALAKGGFALSPGTYRLEVKLDGFHAFYEIIDLKEGGRVVVEPQLARKLP